MSNTRWDKQNGDLYDSGNQYSKKKQYIHCHVGGAGVIGDVPDAIPATGALGLGVSEAPVVAGNGVERVAARPNGA